MVKTGLAVAIFVQVIGLTIGILPQFLSIFDIRPDIVHLSKDLQVIRIPFLGVLGPVGYVALPLNSLCRTPVANYLVCYVCNQDCIYDHNTYGGRCGPNPHNPEENVCICARTIEDANERNIYASSQDTCTNYIGYAPLPAFIGIVADDAFELVIRSRMELSQCILRTDGSYEDSGCTADCKVNHGGIGGQCVISTPVSALAGTTETLHCECDY